MSDPFRDSEQTALARVEDLESENERLTTELAEARGLVGENHQAFVKHLEDQIRDLKRDNAYLNDQTSRALAPVPRELTPAQIQAQKLGFAIFCTLIGLALAVIMIMAAAQVIFGVRF